MFLCNAASLPESVQILLVQSCWFKNRAVGSSLFPFPHIELLSDGILGLVLGIQGAASSFVAFSNNPSLRLRLKGPWKTRSFLAEHIVDVCVQTRGLVSYATLTCEAFFARLKAT